MDEDQLPTDSLRREARQLRARLDETRSLLSDLSRRLQGAAPAAGGECPPAKAPAPTLAPPRAKPAATAGRRALAARAYDLAAMFRELDLPGTGEFEEFVTQALDTEAGLRDAELRVEAVRSQARELSAKVAGLESALEQARSRGDDAQALAGGLETRAAELAAKLREAQKRGDDEAAKAGELATRAAELAAKLSQAQQRGDDQAAKAAELEARLQQARKRGDDEAARARDLEARTAEAATQLRQAEQRARDEAARAEGAAARAAGLEAELAAARDGAPPAPDDSRLEAPAPIPALEPVLDQGWSKALSHLRQALSAAYAQLRRLSATPLGDEQRARLKAAAGCLAQGTDALTALAEFWDEAGPAPAPGRLETAAATAVALWEPALRRRGISLARRQDAALPAALFHPEGLRLALYQVLRNAYESMPRGGSLTVRLFKDEAANAACVSISDTGTGFSREALARLPAPFASAKPGHLGLGLALTRRILDRWGAALETVNNEKIGATVTLRFALGQDEPPPLQDGLTL